MRLFRFFSSLDELIGTGEVCGERSPMKYITPADGPVQIKADLLLGGFKEQLSSHYIHSFHVKG